jgi:hypothetical protein
MKRFIKLVTLVASLVLNGGWMKVQVVHPAIPPVTDQERGWTAMKRKST